MPTLRKGASGDDVITLQNELIKRGYYPRTSDGSRKKWEEYGTFGDETYTQVIMFQMDEGLTQDGIVGKNTWKALGYTGSSAAIAPYTTPSATPASYSPTSMSGGITQQVWFWPAVIGGSIFSVVLIGTLVVAMRD